MPRTDLKASSAHRRTISGRCGKKEQTGGVLSQVHEKADSIGIARKSQIRSGKVHKPEMTYDLKNEGSAKNH